MSKVTDIIDDLKNIETLTSAPLPITGGSLTGALNEALATVASHATTSDIWGALGNQIDWTGTATTTAFPNAPQAGATRELICAGACSFTAGANMLIDGVTSGNTVTCAVGDTVIVRAISTTQFKLTRLVSKDQFKTINGNPIVGIGDITVQSGGIVVANPAGGILTDASKYHAFINNAAYTLPNIMGSNSFGLMSLANSASVPATVTTSDGWTVTPSLTALTTKVVAPHSTATPHGTWGNISMTPPVLNTADLASINYFNVVSSIKIGDILVCVVPQTTDISVVAINTITGEVGTPVNITSSLALTMDAYHSIYQDSATTFVVIASGTSVCRITAASLSGVTITKGTSINTTVAMSGVPVKIADGQYLIALKQANGLQPFSVAGTVCTFGTAISGAASNQYSKLVFLETGKALYVYDVGVNPSAYGCVVVSVSGNVATLGAASNNTTAISQTSTNNVLVAVSATSVIFGAGNSSTSANGNWYGVSISGTTPTIGTVLTVTSMAPQSESLTLPIDYTTMYQDFRIYGNKTDKYSSNTILFTKEITTNLINTIALKIVGNTISVSNTLVGASTTQTTGLIRDYATKSNVYLVTGSSMSLLNVDVNNVLSIIETVAASPTTIFSTTMNNKAVKYNGQWYAWNIGIPYIPLSASSFQLLSAAAKSYKEIL